MKARIKSTGEIVEVKPCKDLIEAPIEMYEDENGTRHFPFQLEFGKEPDWEQRMYEIAKSMLPTVKDIKRYDNNGNLRKLNMNEAAYEAVKYADALIAELKNTEK